MWNEISFSAWIHHMLHALAWYSIIIVHQPSNFSYVSPPKYKLHLLLHCMASRSQPQTYFQDFFFCLFSVFWNKIFIVLYMQIFMHEQLRRRQTNFKRLVQDRIVHSSSICCYLSALASFRCGLYLCFCPLSHSLSPLQCQLETVGAHMQHREKKKKNKLKPRCLVYFSLSEHDRWKIEGERKHSRHRRQLWNLGEPTATNLGFTCAQWCTVGSRGGALLCFWRRGREWEKMAANEVGGLWSIVLSCSQ